MYLDLDFAGDPDLDLPGEPDLDRCPEGDLEPAPGDPFREPEFLDPARDPARDRECLF